MLCFNAKPGFVTEYDLRKEGECITYKLSSKEEVTAVAISPSQRDLVLGQNDGVVRIFDLASNRDPNSAWNESSTISAFTNVNGRKGGVSRLKFHPNTRALFAASTVGCVKLLRLGL